MPDPLPIHGMYRNAQIEHFAPGDRLPCEVAAGQAVTGGRIVAMVGTLEVQHAGAAATDCVGVALWDVAADATERELTVATVGVWPLRAGGAISAGDPVVAGANGTVVADTTPTAGTEVGKALEDIANGEDGMVRLTL